jgi:hypothetical protein
MSATERTTWEYRRTGPLSNAELNELGADAWELVGVAAGELYFKRPGMSFKERVTLEQRAHYYASLDAPALEEDLP